MKQDPLGQTVQLLAAFFKNTAIRSDELPRLIALTHAALSELPMAGKLIDEPIQVPPADTLNKSLAKEGFVISFIDGKPYKNLKRHLAHHGLTPETYSARYGLAATYPMAAPNYTANARREVARQLSLNRKRGVANVEEAGLASSSPSSPTSASSGTGSSDVAG